MPLICLGPIAYLMVNYVVYGSAFAFIEMQREHWFRELAPPWEGLVEALWGIFWRDPSGKLMVSGAELLFGIFGLVCVIYAVGIKLHPSYTLYMVFTWLVAASTRFWLSMPRYLLSMFPLFIVLAVIGDKRAEWQYGMTIAFLLFYSFFLVLFTQGYWAF